MIELLPNLLALGAVAVASYTDVRTRRIPNRLTLPLALVGLGLNAFLAGRDGVVLSTTGWLLGLGLEDVSVRAFDYVEYGAAGYLVSLAERGAAWAGQDGAMTREAADVWLRELRDRGERGTFFGALTYLAVLGRTPAS